jgi:hypothetical protein
MTATITPPAGVPFLTRRDPAVRLADYRDALSLYLQVRNDAIDRIVFADNSESDLSTLASLVRDEGHGKDVELLSFAGPDYPVEQGRSVGETYLIEEALSKSRILSGLRENELFWKVTGRLQIRNIGRLALSTPPCDLYIDLRRHRLQWADTRVFAVTPAGFRTAFLARIEMLRHDRLPPGAVAPEQLLFAELLGLHNVIRIEPRLRVEPHIAGSSGFGENYRRPRRRVESSVRALTRRFIPSLWI